jgi:hypothetical protein
MVAFLQPQIAFIFQLVAIFQVPQNVLKFVSPLTQFCQHLGNINP